MKKKIVSLMAAAAMLLGTACSNQLDDVDVVNNGVVELEEASAPSADDIWGEGLSLDEIDADAYIEEHPEIFGNVLNFESMDDVEYLLEEMANMNYQDLSAKYEDLKTIRGFSNDVIESNILYDQLYTEVAAVFGYDLLTKEAEIEDDDFYDALETRLLEENSSLIYTYDKTVVDTETGESISGTFIEPICGLGLDALTNEKHIVVIDKAVLYFIESAIISLPINKYHRLAGYAFESYEALEMALYSNSIEGLSLEDVTISHRGRTQYPTTPEEKKQKHHVGFNSAKNRMMSVDIDAYASFTGGTILTRETVIANYKKTRLGNWPKMWSHIEGEIIFKVHYVIDTTPRYFNVFLDFTNPNYVHNRKTFHKSYYLGGHLIYDVYPYDISIGLRNWQGCSIRY